MIKTLNEVSIASFCLFWLPIHPSYSGVPVKPSTVETFCSGYTFSVPPSFATRSLAVQPISVEQMYFHKAMHWTLQVQRWYGTNP